MLTLLAIAQAVDAQNAQNDRRFRRPERQRWLRAITTSQVREDSQALGAPPPPVVFVRGLKNASSDGELLCFDDEWLDGLVAKVCADCASNRDWQLCASSVVQYLTGHQTTHHAQGDALRPASVRLRHEREHRADAVGTRLMLESGGDPSVIPRVLRQLGGDAPSSTHPRRRDRLRNTARVVAEYEASVETGTRRNRRPRVTALRGRRYPAR